MLETTLITADRSARPGDEPEAEPVLIEDHGAAIRFVLDDGATLDFDASELRSILRV
jgi:hypothetical protein